MKKSLVVLLILVLVAGAVFAAAEPKFSGRFRFGYKFSFSKDETFINRNWGDNELKLKLEFGTDVWKLAVKKVGVKFDSDESFGANLTFNIDKVADMGDHKLALSMGANDKVAALTVYEDVANGDDGWFKFKNNGKVTFAADYGYGDILKAKVVVDPVSSKDSEAVEYKDAGSAYYEYSWEDEDGNEYYYPIVVRKESKVYNKASFLVAVQGNLLDSALKIAAQYGFRPYVYSIGAKRVSGLLGDYLGVPTSADWSKLWGADFGAYNGFGASVALDIAKLVGMDASLRVLVFDNWAAGKANESSDYRYNEIAASVIGGVPALNGYVEASVETSKKNKDADTESLFCLAFGAKSSVIENIPLEVFAQFNDLGNKVGVSSFKVGLEAGYKVFALNLAYGKFKKAETGVFTVTPKMVLSF